MPYFVLCIDLVSLVFGIKKRSSKIIWHQALRNTHAIKSICQHAVRNTYATKPRGCSSNENIRYKNRMQARPENMHAINIFHQLIQHSISHIVTRIPLRLPYSCPRRTVCMINSLWDVIQHSISHIVTRIPLRLPYSCPRRTVCMISSLCDVIQHSISHIVTRIPLGLPFFLWKLIIFSRWRAGMEEAFSFEAVLFFVPACSHPALLLCVSVQFARHFA